MQAGQTIQLDLAVFDANGTRAFNAGAGVSYAWEVSSNGVNWSLVQGVNTSGVVLGTVDVGKFIRGTVLFFDDAGFLESYTVTSTVRIAPPPDTTVPTLVSLFPASGSTSFAVDGTFVLKFSEAITRGSGTLLLTDASGATVESFSAASSTALGISDDTLVIDPSVLLQAGQTYRLTVPPGAIRDLAGNAFAGFSLHSFATAPPSNRAPTAASVALTVVEDGILEARLPPATDPDGDAITYLLTVGASQGATTLSTAGVLFYQPRADFHGSDVVQFAVRDAKGASSSYSVTIRVTPVNDAPVATSGRAELDEDRTLSGRLPPATDADGDSLTYTLLGSPSRGVATVTATGEFTYTPQANVSGADVLRFRVADPSGAFVDRTLDLSIRPIPDEFLGTPGDDRLPGFDGADIYRAGNGNDHITGGGGDDELNGGSGIDIAAYSGKRSDHVVSRDGAGWKVEDRNGQAGLDRLVEVERLQFSDVSLALDLDGNAGSVARVIRALLGPESLKVAAYVGHGLKAADSGASESNLVALAIAAAQLDAMGSADFARTLYRNVVGVEPDSQTLASFAGMLDRGELSRTSLV